MDTGFHNLLADMRKSGIDWIQFSHSEQNPYVKPEVTDSPLTHKGRLQAEAHQVTTVTSGVELVVVSPQCCAVQTGLLAYQHLNNIGTTKFVANENVREESGIHLCDKRRSRTQAEKEFPNVDWSDIKHDEDPIFQNDHRENKSEVGERIYNFLLWLQSRDEKVVAVASHSGWLMTLFNGVCVTDEKEKSGLRQWFQTGEMRTVTLVWRGGRSRI